MGRVARHAYGGRDCTDANHALEGTSPVVRACDRATSLGRVTITESFRYPVTVRHRRRIGLLAVSLAMACVLQCDAASVQIQAGSAQNYSRSVVRTASGKLYAVILDTSSSNAIRVYESTNGGSSWMQQDASHAPVGGFYSSPSAAIDGNGIIHIAYWNATQGLRYVTFLTATNAFSGDALIEPYTTFTPGVPMTAIAVDSNNATHILYEDEVRAHGSNWDTVTYVDNVGSGSGWNSKVQIFGAPTQHSGYVGDILINQNNVSQVSYLQGNNPLAVAAAIGNANKATSFTSQIVVSTTYGVQQPSIVMDSANNTWVAYLAGQSGAQVPAVIEHRASDSWSTWQTPVQDSSGSVYCCNSSASLAASGTTLYIAYPSALSPNNVVWQSYNGSSWSPVANFDQFSYTPVLKWSEYFNNGGSSQLDVLISGSAGAYWNEITSTIWALSPTSGSVGTSVTITGSNFGATQGTSTVTFNGVAATPTSWSATSIVVPVPTGAATGPVVVTVGGAPSNAVSFSVPPIPPSISSLSPTSGPIGTNVTITGQAFGATQGTSTVTFGGFAAGVLSWSNTNVTVLVPPSLNAGPGPYNVIVTVAGLLSNGSSFTVTPAINSISPAVGPVGALISISGTNFGCVGGPGCSPPGAGTVTFNGVAGGINTWENSYIQVAVPSGASAGPLVATLSGLASNAINFTVSVSITSISPTSGGPGAVVTINGPSFGSTQGTSRVTFNGVPATPISWSNASIVVPAPAGVTTGPVQVSIGGSTSNGITFTTSPAITTLSPTAGPLGTSVTITGSNFGGSQGSTSFVSFNGTYASVSSWTSTRIIATVPTGATTGPVTVNENGSISNSVTFTVGTGSLAGIVSRASDGTPVSGASVQTLQANAVISSTNTAADGSYSCSNLAPGSYDLRVSASGQGTALQQGNTVTTGGTTTVNVSLAAAGTLSGQVTQSGGSAGISNASVTVNQGTDSLATTSTDSSGNYSIPSLSAGSYSVQASATGFTGQTQSNVTITAGNTTTANFSLTGQSVITYSYDELGRLVGTADSLSDVVAYQYDPVGNLLSISRNHSSQLVIVDFTPKTGPVGTTVTVSGTGFSTTPGQNSVSFNGTAATALSATATQITTTVPTGATTGTIAITAPAGTATSSGTFTIGATSAPTIAGFTPTIGVAGTALTINGTNFDPTTANDRVKLNASIASPSSATATALSTTVPSSTSSGHITIGTESGQVVTSSYFYVPPSPYTVASVGYTGSAALGSSTSVAINTAGQIGLVAFDGTAGQGVSVQTTNSTFSSCGVSVSILSTTGSTLSSSSCMGSGGFISTVSLPKTGSYTLLVVPASSGTGTLTMSLYSVTNITGPMTPSGSAVNLNFATPGQTARLMWWNGTAGQKVSVQSTGGTLVGCQVYISILKPDGSTLMATTCMGNGGFTGEQTLNQTGNFTLLVQPTGTNTGTLTVQMYAVTDISGTITPGGSPVSLNFTTPGQSARLTWSGAPGQKVSVQSTGGTLVGCQVYDSILNPDGSGLMPTTCMGNGGFTGEKTLNQTGNFTLLVQPTGTNIGTLTVQLWAVTDITGSITIGGSGVALNFTTPGQTARLTFSGTSGQQVSAHTTNSTFSSCGYVAMSILNPDGSTLVANYCMGSNGDTLGSATLATGTYTLYAQPGANTGSLTVTLTSP